MTNGEKVKELIDYCRESLVKEGNREEEKIYSTNQGGKISITGFQRKACMGYPKALDLMNHLIKTEAVCEIEGFYYVVSVFKFIKEVSLYFDVEIPQNVACNWFCLDVEGFFINGGNSDKSQRQKERIKAFKKKRDIAFKIETNVRNLLKNRVVFNIEKEKVLAFYDENKSIILNCLNTYFCSIDSEMRFVRGLDYEDVTAVSDKGKVETFFQIDTAFLKERRELTLALLCFIIKIYWNVQNKNKIYSYHMFEFDIEENNENNIEFYDMWFSDCWIEEIEPF